MSEMEIKMDAVMRFLVAEDPESREAAAGRLRRLLDEPGSTGGEIRVRQILLELGIPDRLQGHRYLVFAILQAAEDPECLTHITRRLYLRIARRWGTKPQLVERCIRHAIEVAWSRGELEVLYHYFGNTVSASMGRPTNTEFIARIANLLRAGEER